MANHVQTAICSHSASHRSLRYYLFAFAAVVLLATGFCFCSTAQAQQTQYDEMEIDPRYQMESDAPLYIQDRRPRFEELTDEEKKQVNSRNRTAKSNISTDSKKVEAIIDGAGSFDDPVVGDFLNGYVFAKMTRDDVEWKSNLGELREDFLKDFLPKSFLGGRRVQFIDSVVVPALNNIINNKDLKQPNQNVNYHPRVRMNAVVLMGMLDDQAGNRLDNQVPIPSKKAWTELNRIFADANLPTGCKVSAIVGIHRHFQVDRVIGDQISDADKQKWASDMANLLAGNAAGQDQWPSPINYWLKRYAAQIIGMVGEESSLDALLAALKSEKQDWLAMDTLEAIGRLDLKNAPKAKITDAAVGISQFLAERFEQESTTIDANVEKLIYDNMLFQDLDLEESGTTYGPGQAMDMAAGGAPSSGPGSGRPSMGGMPGGSAGGMAGLSGPGSGFGPPGGIPGMVAPEEKVPLVELPNYQLNQSRTRLKAFGFTGMNILSSEPDGLKLLADDETKTFIDGVVSDISLLLGGVNEGIVNLDEDPRNRTMPDEDEEPKSYTKKLAELSLKTSKDLSSKIRAQKGEDEVNPLAQPDTTTDASTQTGSGVGTNN